jgi:hypothetical protein
MARHELDAPNNDIDIDPDWNHQDLTTLYPTPGALNTNPISTSSEKEARYAAERQAATRKIRKESYKIGLNITFPFLLGLFTVQHVLIRVYGIQPGDLGSAMFVVFTSFLAVIGTGEAAYLGFRYVTNAFYFHALKGWPIILTVLMSLVTATVALQPLAASIEGGWIGYILGLIGISVVGSVPAAFLTFIWSSSLPAKIKIFILCDVFILSAGLLALLLLHPLFS